MKYLALILFLVCSTLYAHECEIADNQDIPTNTLEVGPGKTYPTCSDAVKAAKDGDTISIYPGNYNSGCGVIRRRGSISIIGIIDAQGNRPVFNVPLTDTSKPQKFLVYTPISNSTLTVKNIEVTGEVSTCILASRYGTVKIDNVLCDGMSRKRRTKASNGIWISAPYNDDSYDHRLEITNTEVRGFGNGGNKHHNLYLNAHTTIIDGLYSHSSHGGHALKIGIHLVYDQNTSPSVIVRNSVLRTTDQTELSPDDKYASTTLLDMYACGDSIIENNLFDFRLRTAQENNVGASTGTYIVNVRRRRDISGCDKPAYSSPEFWSKDFWLQPPLFSHTIKNNVFLSRGPSCDKAVAIRNGGTYPISPVAPHGDLAAPEWWFERATIYSANNAFPQCVKKLYQRGFNEAHPAPIVE